AATELFSPNEGSRDANRILFVGRLNEQKGILRLLEAAAPLPARTTIDVVGEGPLGSEAREAAKRFGLADRVQWLGALPQQALPDLYRQASVLAVPSLDEGLGLAAVESQLCGTPVVAFDSGGIGETLQNGVTGRLVPSGNVAAFTEALQSILGDPRAAHAMGRAGVEWARAHFAPEVVAANYAKLYRAAAT
ncbi:MAG: glycosyltransferase family 4 protein, partial [Gemmatimonadaceae bacterium]